MSHALTKPILVIGSHSGPESSRWDVTQELFSRIIFNINGQIPVYDAATVEARVRGLVRPFGVVKCVRRQPRWIEAMMETKYKVNELRQVQAQIKDFHGDAELVGVIVLSTTEKAVPKGQTGVIIDV